MADEKGGSQGETAKQGKLPWWAQVARVVALVTVGVMFVMAYFWYNAPPEERLTWEKLGSSAFGIALMAVMMLFTGRAQTRK